MGSAFPLIRGVAEGTTASSLHEARVGAEEFGGPVHAYAPVYLDHEWEEWRRLCRHVTFNSLAQHERFRSRAEGLSRGLRVNPEYSEAQVDLYNPCVPGSRLGVLAADLGAGLPEGIEGLHVHNLCECAAAATVKTLDRVRTLFGRFLPGVRWLNLGGGHLLTRQGYDIAALVAALRGMRAEFPRLQIILEPGAAFVWDAGVLVTSVVDVVENRGIVTAILDVSFAAHMPDCLEMPYRPGVIGAREPRPGERGIRLGGLSCLAGDYVGDYVFDSPVRPGTRIVFTDMLHYTMVKTNMFNGVNLPAIGIWHTDGRFENVRTFGYADYRGRLG
jgi:carboxynorspermidine decarboxylase